MPVIRLPRSPLSALLALAAFLFGGCAVRYYDARTGTEHVWGLAHVKMRVAPAMDANNPPAVATQVESLGLGLGLGSGPAADSSIHLGWDRRTRVLVPDDTALALEWPTTDLFDVRIGHQPPFLASPANPSPSPAAASPSK